MQRVEPSTKPACEPGDSVLKEQWIRPEAIAQKVQNVTERSNVTNNLADLTTCAS
jgi:hypothetical protein